MKIAGIVGGMTKPLPDLTVCRYNRHRFPAEIIADAVWPSFRFPLSLRHVGDLLAERGIEAQRLDLQHRLCLLLFLSKEGLYRDDSARISDLTLDTGIRQLLESHRKPDVTVAGQGGEPNEAGVFRGSCEAY